jgi:hypothetical protein
MDDTGWRTEGRRRQAAGARVGVGRRAALIAGLAAWAAAGSACSDGGTEPPPPPQDVVCPSAGVPVCSNPAPVREAVSDAIDRSVTALESATARNALAASLGKLQAALAGNPINITNARVGYDESRSALGAAGGAPGDAPDLGAVELMLDYVGPLIGR